MTDQVVLIGGGGHCKSCIDVLEKSGYSIAGILDREPKENNLLGYPYLGNDEALEEFIATHHFLITIGQIRSAAPRQGLYEKIKRLKGSLPAVVSSLAHVSDHATIGEGTIVMHHALVNAASVVGKNCIINTKALIEHDCLVGDHTHISTGAIINGGCVVGSRVFIGSQAVLAHGVKIADDVVVGAGTVVIDHIEEAGVYAGNPARNIKS